MNNLLLGHNISNTKHKITFHHARGKLVFQNTHTYVPQIQILRWIKPPYHFFKLNTDASYNTNSNSSFGGILRDHLGKMLFCYFGPIISNSPLEAEFLAILIGCRLCKEHNIDFKHLILESDSNTLVDSIISYNCPRYNYLKQWKELLNYAQNIHLIKHTFREANSVADLLAIQGKSANTLVIYFSMHMLDCRCRNYILLDQREVPYIKTSINN
jgi:ribonuclease HI